jgi:succinate dehydrogenase / fumarate reductase cytochrome b subunit
MEDANATDVPSTNARTAPGEDRLRRLHSLTGVVPLGAFLLLHLWTSSALLGSRAAYDRQVGALHGSAVLTALEIVLVLVPLAYHAGYGVWRSLQPREAHAYDSDLMHTLERASGVLVLVFLGAHFYELRWQTLIGGLQVSSYSTKLVEHLSWTTGGVPFIALGYLLGIAATIFHLVNGMTSFCITWGYTATELAQRRARLLFRALGVVFFLVGAATVIQLASGIRFFHSAEQPSSAACGSAVVEAEAPPRAASSSANAASSAPGAAPSATATPPK